MASSAELAIHFVSKKRKWNIIVLKKTPQKYRKLNEHKNKIAMKTRMYTYLILEHGMMAQISRIAFV